jgi:hypothetical protein
LNIWLERDGFWLEVELGCNGTMKTLFYNPDFGKLLKEFVKTVPQNYSSVNNIQAGIHFDTLHTLAVISPSP